eukprot:scaffold111634_cov45-Phaeocystis_antarctica.AAC.2
MSPFLRCRGWKMRTVHRSALRRQEGGHSEQELSEVEAGCWGVRGAAVVAEVLERVLLLERLLHDGGGEGGDREAQVDDHLERVDAGQRRQVLTQLLCPVSVHEVQAELLAAHDHHLRPRRGVPDDRGDLAHEGRVRVPVRAEDRARRARAASRSASAGTAAVQLSPSCACRRGGGLSWFRLPTRRGLASEPHFLSPRGWGSIELCGQSAQNCRARKPRVPIIGVWRCGRAGPLVAGANARTTGAPSVSLSYMRLVSARLRQIPAIQAFSAFTVGAGDSAADRS